MSYIWTVIYFSKLLLAIKNIQIHDLSFEMNNLVNNQLKSSNKQYDKIILSNLQFSTKSPIEQPQREESSQQYTYSLIKQNSFVTK